eukprot:UN3519
MHEHDFAHLDVKPNNVLVSLKRGKLADFETAQHLPKSGRMYLTGIGTPGFRAPELYKPMECDARKADIWSLGRCGEFTDEFVKGCWRGMDALIEDNPEVRPPVKACLDMFKQLNGSMIIS